MHVLVSERYDFLSFGQPMVQLVWSEAIPGGQAVVEKENGTEVGRVKVGTLQTTPGESQIELQDPIVIHKHALVINIDIL